jgi:glycosyltransferase involved in cell wall biosynthesis
MFMDDVEDKIISIVTPSYNQSQFISETIESVISQRGNFYIDYVIMDGGSTDGTREVLNRYEKLFIDNYQIKNIRGVNYYVAGEKNTGYIQCLGVGFRWFSEKDNGQADAINKGFNISVGDIFAFLNSDDVYCQNTFQRIADLDWNNFDFLYGEGMWINSRGENLCLYPTLPPTKYFLHGKCTLCQPTVFFKKETYIKLGQFDNSFFCSFDYEYWVRAVFKNCKFKHIHAILAKSRMYIENKSLSNKNTVADNCKELIKKYYGNIKLNKIFLWITKNYSRKFTHRREKKMFSLLSR